MAEEVRAQLVNIKFDHGIEGGNEKQRSVIFRPFNRIIEQGKPTGYVKFLFLNTEKKDWDFTELKDTKKIPAQTLRVFGVLCHTEGGKILFYPGFTSTYLLKYRDRDKPTRNIPKINIDHFSLERSLNRWHITHSTGKVENHTVKHLAEGIIRWFGISIKSTVKLEQVFQYNPFAYLCPVSDADRRVNDIAESLKYRKEIVITPGNSNCRIEPIFWHFEFYIKTDPKTFGKSLGLTHIPVKETNLLIPKDSQVPWFSYETDILPFYGKLVIVSTTVPGILPDDVVISY
jgi:hypothetical protein